MMSLRKKIILAIGLLLIVVMSGAYLVQQIVLTASFARLEEQELRAHLARVHNTLTVELAQLESITADWARWDDTYQFVEDANDAYVKSNLTDSAFENLRLNVMVFVHSSGRIVSAKGYDLHNHRAIPTPPSLTPHLTRESALLRHPDLMSGTRGILLLPEGPLLVSALPILTSENQGPSRGTLLFGRFLDEDEIARWGETIQLSLVARRWDDPALPADFRSARAALSATAPNHTRALDEQVSAGYLLLSDVYAQPALILRVTMPRDIMQQGRLSQTILATILGISGLIAFALAMWGLDRLIIRRLARLAQQVHRIGERGTSTQRVAITGNDELGTLEREINRMLEAIPASEERFRALVEHSNDLILILNRDATIRYVTPSAQTILGYTPEELGGRSALELIHPDDRATAQEAFTHRLAHPGASDLPMTLRAQHRDGSLRTIELLGSNLLDNPAVAGIVINGHDITARERAERALRESEDRYRDLVEQSHAFICTHDLQGNFLSANEWAMRLIGYENFSAASVNLREILAPETRDQVDEYLARIQRDGYAEGLMLVQTRAGEKRLWEYHNTLRTEGVAEPIVRGIAHDITEQKKLERALRESEERWRAYIEQANDFIFALDASARVTLANRALCDALGYAPEELIGKSPLEFVAPEARADAQRTLAHIFRGEQLNDFETVALTRAQRRITLEIRGRAFRQDGRIVGTLHIARDITARKDAEELLRQQKQQYQSLIENISDIVALVDTHRFIRYVSPSVERVLGYPPADLIGADVFELTHPDEQAMLEEALQRAFQNPYVSHRLEHRLRHQDGTWRDCETIAQAHQREDGMDVAISTRDITERKRADAALTAERNLLRTMVDAIPDSIFVKDTAGRFLLNNAYHLQALGVAAQTDTLGKTLFDFHSPDLAELYDADDRFVLTTGQPIIEKEQPYIHHTRGERRWHLMTKVPLRDAQGQITGLVGIGRDITERKKIEDELRRSRKEWQDIFNAIGHPTFTLDLQHGVTAANPAALKQLGKTEMDVIGKKCYHLFHGSNCAPFNCPMEALLRSGKMQAVEMEMQTVAGTYLVSCTPVLDAQGRPEKVIHIATDITALKRAQTELQEANARFYALVEGIPDIVYLKDSQGRNLYVNKAYEEFAGTTRANIIGKGDDELMPPELAAACAASDAQVFEQGLALRSEEYTRDRAGDIICYETIKSPIRNAAGRITGLVGVSRDITARKRAERALAESEKRLRALIESAPIAISLGRDGKLIYANPAYVRMYGFASADELIGQPVTERLSPQCRDESLERSRLRARGESVETQYELIGLRKDGSEFPMLAMVTRVQLADGPANIGFFQDITERKRAEAALKEYSERLEQMVEARTRELRDAQEQLVRQERLAILGQVAGSIAHELRSPLGAIKNAVYYFKLCIENPSPEAREMMQILDQQVDVSARIIGSLLDFARPKPPTLQRVEIPHVIRAALDQCELPANVALEWQLAPDLPSAMLDAAQMQVVFRNLIANALQAMPEGGRLTISARTISDFRFKISDLPTTPHGVETRDHKSEILKQQSAIEIRISDTGVGIPPDALDKIFQPLYTTKAKGIGLGLAMCKTIIEAHGGAIAAESTVGKGATFIVRLPVGQ
jgi:PAS domain S-box-containing protein